MQMRHEEKNNAFTLYQMKHKSNVEQAKYFTAPSFLHNSTFNFRQREYNASFENHNCSDRTWVVDTYWKAILCATAFFIKKEKQ